MPNHPSPFTAIAMLLLFKQRRVPMTRQDFDLYFDTILEVLEEVNNERFRLEKEEP